MIPPRPAPRPLRLWAIAAALVSAASSAALSGPSGEVKEGSTLTDPEAARFARATFSELMANGGRAFEERRYARAARAFFEATLKDPQSARAAFAAADSLFAVGEYHKAVLQIRRGLILYPDWPDLNMDRLRYYSRPSDFEAQLRALELAALDNPSSPALRFLLGYNFFFTKRYVDASWEFLIALNEDKNFDPARLFLKRLDAFARRNPRYRDLPHTHEEAERYGPEDAPWIKALRRELGRPVRLELGRPDWIEVRAPE